MSISHRSINTSTTYGAIWMLLVGIFISILPVLSFDSTTWPGGIYFQTQDGFHDAQAIYSPLLNAMFQTLGMELRNTPPLNLPHLQANFSHSFITSHGTTLKLTILDNSTIQVNISAPHLTINNIDATILAFQPIPCPHLTLQASFSFDFELPITLGDAGSLSFNATNVYINHTDLTIKNCNFLVISAGNKLLDLFTPIFERSLHKVISALETNTTKNQVVPIDRTDQNDTLFLIYNFTNVESVPLTSMTYSTNFSLLIHYSHGGIEYFYPQQTSTPLSPSKNITFPDGSDYLLGGLRFSSILAEGFIWYMDMTQQLNITDWVQILDGNLTTNLFFDPPIIGVDPSNSVYIHLSSGSTALNCNDCTTTSMSLINMFNATFSSLTSYGQISFTNQTNPGVSFEFSAFDSVFDFKINQPSLPFKKDELSEAMFSLLNDFIPTINSYLVNYPLLLPTTLIPLFPNPTISTVHQNDPNNIYSGYFQMDSYCSCDLDLSKPIYENCLFCVQNPPPHMIRTAFHHPSLLFGSSTPQIQNTKIPATTKNVQYLAIYNNPTCSFLNFGDTIHTFQLNSSVSGCFNVSFDNFDMYFAVNSNSSINFPCSDDTCSSCHSSDTLQSQYCTASDPFGSLVLDTPCIGFTKNDTFPLSPLDIIAQQYFQTSGPCTFPQPSSLTPDSLVYSLTLLQHPTTSECNDYTLLNPQSNGRYHVSLSCPNTSCVDCSYNYFSLDPHVCRSPPQEISIKLMYANDTWETCGFSTPYTPPPPNPDIPPTNKNLNITDNLTTEQLVAIIGLPSLALSIIFFLSLYFRTVRTKNGSVYYVEPSSTVIIIEWIIGFLFWNLIIGLLSFFNTVKDPEPSNDDSKKPSFNIISKSWRYHAVCVFTCFSIISSILILVTIIIFPPFEDITTTEYLVSTGLNISYFDIQSFENNTVAWFDIMLVFCLVALVVSIIVGLLLIYFKLVTDSSLSMNNDPRSQNLSLGSIIHRFASNCALLILPISFFFISYCFMFLTIPPLALSYPETIQVLEPTPSNGINSTIFNSDNTTRTDIGYALSMTYFQIAFSRIIYMFPAFLLPLPAALTLGRWYLFHLINDRQVPRSIISDRFNIIFFSLPFILGYFPFTIFNQIITHSIIFTFISLGSWLSPLFFFLILDSRTDPNYENIPFQLGKPRRHPRLSFAKYYAREFSAFFSILFFIVSLVLIIPIIPTSSLVFFCIILFTSLIGQTLFYLIVMTEYTTKITEDFHDSDDPAGIDAYDNTILEDLPPDGDDGDHDNHNDIVVSNNTISQTGSAPVSISDSFPIDFNHDQSLSRWGVNFSFLMLEDYFVYHPVKLFSLCTTERRYSYVLIFNSLFGVLAFCSYLPMFYFFKLLIWIVNREWLKPTFYTYQNIICLFDQQNSVPIPSTSVMPENPKPSAIKFYQTASSSFLSRLQHRHELSISNCVWATQNTDPYFPELLLHMKSAKRIYIVDLPPLDIIPSGSTDNFEEYKPNDSFVRVFSANRKIPTTSQGLTIPPRKNIPCSETDVAHISLILEWLISLPSRYPLQIWGVSLNQTDIDDIASKLVILRKDNICEQISENLSTHPMGSTDPKLNKFRLFFLPLYFLFAIVKNFINLLSTTFGSTEHIIPVSNQSPQSFFGKLYEFLMEIKERNRPDLYGYRIALRRISIVLGCFTLFYFVSQGFVSVWLETSPERVTDWFVSQNISITWPSTDTFVTPILDAYDAALKLSTLMFYFSILLFCISLYYDISNTRNIENSWTSYGDFSGSGNRFFKSLNIKRNNSQTHNSQLDQSLLELNLQSNSSSQKSANVYSQNQNYVLLNLFPKLLERSCQFSLFGGLCAVFSLIIPNIPNYLNLVDFSTIFPSCAPEFDQRLYSSLQQGSSLFLVFYMSYTLAFVVLSAPFAVIRISAIISEDLHHRFPSSSPKVIPFLKKTIALGGILNFPCLIIQSIYFRQYVDDPIITISLLLFLTLPALVLYLSLQKYPNFGMPFIFWRIAYYSLLLLIIIYELSFDAVVQDLYSLDFYIVLVADFALCDLVAGDLISITILNVLVNNEVE